MIMIFLIPESFHHFVTAAFQAELPNLIQLYVGISKYLFETVT